MSNLNGTPQTFAGVVTAAPQSVHLSIKEQVEAALQGVKEGRTMAILNVKTGSGLNLAVAHKFNDQWEVITYVGKSGWQKPIEGGVSVAFSR
ncbi:MAG: hypothetical protein EB141_12695 [Verrucomicrobia bacterium]|nr:hypothetical protein [Verrucomicrobiota bacterium]NBU11280.1 hypothetical protein [Pseudomonadota bacterium]NDA66521.1 hypothetical protein [Verrucomicrobiota bacterium]NDB76480.1 hypothetical protein [Verrucomicrobiota bacterium]NDD37436.1 hypothetical protein [Verrucomicrobiota bacterium]